MRDQAHLPRILRLFASEPRDNFNPIGLLSRGTEVGGSSGWASRPILMVITRPLSERVISLFHACANPYAIRRPKFPDESIVLSSKLLSRRSRRPDRNWHRERVHWVVSTTRSSTKGTTDTAHSWDVLVATTDKDTLCALHAMISTSVGSSSTQSLIHLPFNIEPQTKNFSISERKYLGTNNATDSFLTISPPPAIR